LRRRTSPKNISQAPYLSHSQSCVLPAHRRNELAISSPSLVSHPACMTYYLNRTCHSNVLFLQLVILGLLIPIFRQTPPIIQCSSPCIYTMLVTMLHSPGSCQPRVNLEPSCPFCPLRPFLRSVVLVKVSNISLPRRDTSLESRLYDIYRAAAHRKASMNFPRGYLEPSGARSGTYKTRTVPGVVAKNG
jgi:hypothetical protein